MGDEFYLILISNANIPEFPLNSLSAFTNIFPEDLDFSKNKWKVALQSICFDRKFSNVPIKLRKAKSHILLYSEKQPYTTANEPSARITLKKNIYTINQLKDILNIEIQQLPLFKDTISLFHKNGFVSLAFQKIDVLIHEEFVKMMKIKTFPRSLWKVIENEKFLVLKRNKNPNHPTRRIKFHASSSLGKSIEPDLIKIVCSQLHRV